MRKALFILFTITLYVSINFSYADQFPARFVGEVTHNGKNLSKGHINVWYNNNIILKANVNSAGYIIKLELDGVYTFEYINKGYYKIRYSVSTVVDKKYAKGELPEFDMGKIEMIPYNDNLNQKFFDEFMGKVYFSNESKAWKYDQAFMKKRKIDLENALKSDSADDLADINDNTDTDDHPSEVQDTNKNSISTNDENPHAEENNTDKSKKIGELEDKLNNTNDKLEKIELQESIAQNYLDQDEPEKARKNIMEAIELAEKEVQPDKLGDLHNTLAKIEFDEGNYEASLENYTKAAQKKTQSDNPKEAAELHNEAGMLAADLYRFDKALDHFNNAYHLMEKQGNKPAMTSLLNNIGNIYYEKGDLDKALDAFKKSLDLDNELGNKKNVASGLNNIGLTYQNSGDFDKAIESYEQSIAVSDELGNQKEVSISLNNIGNANYDWNKFKQALDFYHKSLKIKEAIDYKSGVAYTFHNIGNVHKALKEPKEAIKYYEKSNLLAKELNLHDLERKNYEALSKAYYALQDCDNAYKFYELFTQTNPQSAITDKQFAEFHQRAASEYNLQEKIIKELQGELQKQKLLAKFQNQSKQLKIEIQNKEMLAQEKTAKNQRLIIYSMVGGFIFFLLLLIIIIKENRQKKKANRLLSEQKKEIETQASQLLMVNKELDKLSIVARETDNAVVIANPEGDIVWVNEGFIRLYGYTMDEFIAEKGKTLAGAASNKDFDQLMNNCIESKKSHTYSALTETKNKEKIWVQTTLTPIFDKQGNIKNFVAIDSNITKIKKAEKEIKELLQTAVSQRDQIQEQKQEITDSILYAKRIQAAIFPNQELINQLIPNHFILYRPRDIVSGDFYWINNIEGVTVIAVADCTGHGVPGAFMSMLGVAYLNEIILKEYITHTGVILKRLRKEVIRSLHQHGKDDSTKDGMDIAMIAYNEKTGEVQFSGAHNPLYHVRAGELNVIKGDKMPIGIYDKMDKFTTNELKVEKGDQLYMFSDGYADQFGGPKGKKFKYGAFKRLIKEISDKDMEEQNKLLGRKLDDWQGDYEQIDDILVMGIKV